MWQRTGCYRLRVWHQKYRWLQELTLPCV